MNNRTKKLLLMQGYPYGMIRSYQNIDLLARWTPFACAICGTFGLIIKSPVYFMILGLLTTIGAFRSRSFYDYLYNGSLRYVFGTEATPRHGKPRRFGCGIGSVLFLLGGLGFYTNTIWLAFFPALLIIVLAYVAAITQWCFASTLYNLMFKKNEKCC